MRGMVSDSSYKLMDIFPWGFGVDLFFIISGFIIANVLARLPATPNALIDFIAKRLIRIVPIYWLFTLMMVAVMLVMNVNVSSSLFLPHLLASLAFVPWFQPMTENIRPVLGQGWTLNYEMLFYLVAAVAIFFSRDRRLHVISAVIFALFLTSSLFDEAGVWQRFLSYSVLLEFLIGIWISHYYAYLSCFSSPARIVMGVSGLILLASSKSMPELPRIISEGMPSALIFVAMLRPNAGTSSSLSRVMERIGDASYSLYLSHSFVINGMWLIGKGVFRDHAILFIVSTMVACVIFAVGFYLLVEVRLLAYLQERWRAQTPLIRTPQSA